MDAKFFSHALREALQRKHFNQAQLSEYLDVDPAYVSRWLKGSSPRLEQLRKVLDRLGWQLERAHPDYDPFRDAVALLEQAQETAGEDDTVGEAAAAYRSQSDEQKAELAGLLKQLSKQQSRPESERVSFEGVIRGEQATAVAPEDIAELPVTEVGASLFKSYDWAGAGLGVLVVEDSHLAPVYPAGTNLLVRRVLRSSDVPNGFDIIVETRKEPGVRFLRKLMRIEEREANRVDRVIGAPIGAAQDYISMKPREANFVFAVVGAIVRPPV